MIVTAAPTVVRTRTLYGAGDQIVITATMSDGDVVTFSGSRHGVPGPVIMITAAWGQIRVEAPERFGAEFSAAWVRAFYA